MELVLRQLSLPAPHHTQWLCCQLCLVRLPCGAAAWLAAFSTAGPGQGFLGLAKSITIFFPPFKKFLAIVSSPVPSFLLCVWPLVLKEKKMNLEVLKFPIGLFLKNETDKVKVLNRI